MGKKLTYYNFADNDYWFLKANVEEKRVSNAMCANAQSICERYLKEVVQEKATELNDTDIMKTHSLKKLKKFIISNIPEMECDWAKVIQADGYYFSARYPGEDSYFVDESDVSICWDAVQEVKYSVDRFLERCELTKSKKTGLLDVEEHKKNLHRRMGR